MSTVLRALVLSLAFEKMTYKQGKSWNDCIDQICAISDEMGEFVDSLEEQQQADLSNLLSLGAVTIDKRDAVYGGTGGYGIWSSACSIFDIRNPEYQYVEPKDLANINLLAKQYHSTTATFAYATFKTGKMPLSIYRGQNFLRALEAFKVWG